MQLRPRSTLSASSCSVAVALGATAAFTACGGDAPGVSSASVEPTGRLGPLVVEMVIEGDDWVEDVRARAGRDAVRDAGDGRGAELFCSIDSQQVEPYLVRLSAPGAESDEDLGLFELAALASIPPGGSGGGVLHLRFDRRAGAVDEYPEIDVTIEMDVGGTSGRFRGEIAGGDPGPVAGSWSCR